MFNSFVYNSTNYCALALVSGAAGGDNIIFNDYSLQSADVVSQILLQDSTPDRDFGTSAVPRGDGQIINGDFWRKKNIQVSGVIHKTTNALLEAELDAMKKALAVSEGVLDIKVAGVVRRYLATLVDGHNMFNQRKNYHVTFCPFQVEFQSCEPFGKSVSYNATSFLAESVLVLNEQVNNDGTTHAKPVVILNFTAVNTVVAVSFKNNTTGEEIKITKALTVGDYLKFDSEEMQVTVNGVVQDYTGAFPLLATGSNLFTITVTATSCTYDLTVKHKTPYL